jgi:hypothetical protein
MLGRVLKVVLGVVLSLLGVVLLFVPGPGIPVLCLGVGLVLAQSRAGRRVILRVRVRLRDRFGTESVRRVERRLPREIVGTDDTTAMRRDVLQHEVEKRLRAARRRSRRRD